MINTALLAAASDAATDGIHLLAFNPLSATSWLTGLGAIGVFLVLFAETGLLIGFFLPGDSLLFTAGLLCTTESTSAVHLSLAAVLPAAAAGALLGAQAGFWLGRRGGRTLLARSRNRHLQRGAERAEEILIRYGYGKAIVLARFIPVVRTVLNPLAGALEVPARTFTLWQCVGGLAWSLGVTLAGYALGSSVPNVDTYLLPIIALIVVASLTPLALELRRARRTV
ncbi:MAG TPA: DedA family protein [Actinocrinis sp.]|nr:DedA family protein [Actinocrinis sp.]